MNDVSLFDVDQTTPNIGLTKPAVGGSDDTWGDKLNGNFDIIDTFSGVTKTRNDNQDTSIATNTTNITTEKNRNDTQDANIATNTTNIATNTTNITTEKNRNDTQDTQIAANTTAIAGKISDAPNDGQTYARKNLAWSSITGLYVAKAGDTMTGLLVLSADPSAALGAATKQYSDKLINPAMGLTATQQQNARQNIYAAPFDAMVCQNLVINGGMEVSQQYGGGSVTLPNTSTVNGVVDMFSSAYNHTAATAVFAAAQSAGGYPIGPSFYKLTSTTALTAPAANDNAAIYHLVEGSRLTKLFWGTASAQPIIVSFWVYSSNVTGTAVLTARNFASNRSYCAPFNVTAGQWSFVSITIPGDQSGAWTTDFAAGLRLSWSFVTGSTWQAPAANTWSAGSFIGLAGQSNCFATNGNFVGITGVSVVVGNEGPNQAQANRLIRPFQEELILARRHWRSSYPYGVVPGTVNTTTGQFVSLTDATTSFHSYAKWPLDPVMRASPAVTLYSTVTGASGKCRNNDTAVDLAAGGSAFANFAYAFVNNVAVSASQSVQGHMVLDARMS